MEKTPNNIMKWGKIKPFKKKKKAKFNTIDIETIDNEIFLLGSIVNDKYVYFLDKFYEVINEIIIASARSGRSVLTWTKYDNTYIIKELLRPFKDKDYLLRKLGKISPVVCYKYKRKNGATFSISIENVIKDSIVFKVEDGYNRERTVNFYNLKNLFQEDLSTVAKNYNIEYSKIGKEYHIIDRERFLQDEEYRRLVILSNEYDNKVLLEIADKFLDSFHTMTGEYPRTMFSSGSIARSYLTSIGLTTNFKTMFPERRLGSKTDQLLKYSMSAYHGGKIDSYVIGYVPKAYYVDITSAYPYALTTFPKPLSKITVRKGKRDLDKFFYAFIRCNIYIEDPEFIHPVIIKSPITKGNISPYGYLKDVIITKIEYDFLIQHNIKVEVIDYVGVPHDDNVYPYRDLIYQLFNDRMKYKKEGNKPLEDMTKRIINSIYGIHYELTPEYEETDDTIKQIGFRAGDFFNPVIASYITAHTRTYISRIANNIIENDGKIYLIMTDSIMYDGKITLDVISDEKVLGKLENPIEINDLIIIGAGRYEFKYGDKYTVKSRGFKVSKAEKGYYNEFNLNDKIIIETSAFVSFYKATTEDYSYDELGAIVTEKREIDPFNLGGKRYIKKEDREIDINTNYINTHAIYLSEDIYYDNLFL